MSSERPNEVTACQLNGEAAVYTRQSSKKQDEENRGSLEYQRNQARHPRAWGFREDRIKVYEDRGLSGGAAEHRPAFLAVIDGIKAGRITAVFASDQSRLARNAVEWFQFLNLCRAHGALLVLDGRIINLGDGGDGFSSRIMALVDEYDLEKRRGHVLRGISGRLGDQKAVTAPPTGYISLKEERKGEWEFDPDPAVQAAIAAVFRIFPEQRSCARTVRQLIADEIRIPARKPGGALYWVPPSIGAVRRVLTNPAYRGDYVYRRRVGDPSRGMNRYGHLRVRTARPEETVVIQNHHPGYVSREAWQEIQMVLQMNAPSKKRRNLGPGSALLQGLIGCGAHGGRSMSVDYKDRLCDGRNGAHYYHCLGSYEFGGAQCGALPGKQLDAAVAAAVFTRLARPSLEAIETEWKRERKNAFSSKHTHELALDQAQRRVNDLRSRLLLIDPKLRDLAEDIEVMLNEALGGLKRLKASRTPEPEEGNPFTEDAFAELMALCEDLPGLFYATTTAHRDRKEILRAMIERVVVTGRTPETISCVVVWADGSEPTVVEAHLVRFAHRLIHELADQGLENVEIAKRVNEMGLKTSRGKSWTRETVWVVRFKLGPRQATQQDRETS